MPSLALSVRSSLIRLRPTIPPTSPFNGPRSRTLSTALLFPSSSASALPPTRLALRIPTAFHARAPTPVSSTFVPVRHAVANFRPRKLKYKKAHKGFHPVRTGGSLRGTTVYYGDYGLQALEGGRLSDKQLDSARTGIRRVLKAEKGSRFFLRCFPDRPVTSKGAETRMGKGKGAVDYFATFVAEGRVIVEVKGVRKELAEKAMKVAAAGFPIRTRFVSAAAPEGEQSRVPPRVLPFFVRQRLAKLEFAEFDKTVAGGRKKRSKRAPQPIATKSA